MEGYKEKLKLQNWILGFSCAILACFCVLGLLAEMGVVELTPISGDSHWKSQWRGGISGASFGILVLMLIGLIRNLVAMKDEKKLKKQYVKEHDERKIQIQTAAQAASCRTFLILGLVAAIVVSYFHMIISLVILSCVFAQSFLTLIYKLYYSKKF